MSENPNPFNHELSVGELFGKTFDLLRQNYFRVLPIFVAFGIISTIVCSTISYVTPSTSIPSNLSGLNTAQLSSLLGSVFRYVGYTLANYFVSWCILYFAAALGIWRMNQTLINTPSQRPNYLSLAATTLLSVVIIEAGLFLFLVGALILGTILYLVLVAATVEKKSAISAIGRSRQLVSGKWLKTFCLLAGVQIIILIVSNVISGIVGLPFSGVTSTMAAVVASNFVTALSFPLVSASMLVLYYSNLAGHQQVISRPPSLYENIKPQPIPGFPISQSSFCPKCGSSVGQDEKFCHNCGTQLQA